MDEGMNIRSYEEATVERINELLAAIKDNLNEKPFTKERVEYARLWAVELSSLIDLIQTVMIYS